MELEDLYAKEGVAKSNYEKARAHVIEAQQSCDKWRTLWNAAKAAREIEELESKRKGTWLDDYLSRNTLVPVKATNELRKLPVAGSGSGWQKVAITRTQ